VAEALCWQCNPALIPAYQAVADWCAEHGLPESRCLQCNPGLADVPTATDTDGSLPRKQRPPSITCTTQQLTVTLERPEIAAEAGLEYATVRVEAVTRTLECNAELAYDGNRHARLAPQVPGMVSSVNKDLGDPVAPGEVLATIVSPAFGAAKASYLQADAVVALWQKHHAREADLLARGVSTEKDVVEAETHLAESRIALSRAEQELLSLGLSPAQIVRLQETGDTTASYQVTAPFAGVVVERQAVVGEVCDPSQSLFGIADVTRMWALLDVYESEVREIRAGQPVILQVEGLAGVPFAGTITWVSSQLDPRTRTLRARAELENPDSLLRANMFARATVTVRQQMPTVVVPRQAVQWEGCCNVVFVRTSDTTFVPRKVNLGPATGAVFEVVGGLEGGETVVTQGSFLLKTEILKGNIGAGCCEAQPGT
jgi:cobalt-zinc-cadmium efflux system membrane fusion protein